jgi:hypothetical protein
MFICEVVTLWMTLGCGLERIGQLTKYQAFFAPRSDKLMEENENMREFQPWIWVKDQGCSII